jgi:hypothetical protein
MTQQDAYYEEFYLYSGGPVALVEIFVILLGKVK